MKWELRVCVCVLHLAEWKWRKKERKRNKTEPHTAFIAERNTKYKIQKRKKIFFLWTWRKEKKKWETNSNTCFTNYMTYSVYVCSLSPVLARVPAVCVWVAYSLCKCVIIWLCCYIISDICCMILWNCACIHSPSTSLLCLHNVFKVYIILSHFYQKVISLSLSRISVVLFGQ